MRDIEDARRLLVVVANGLLVSTEAATSAPRPQADTPELQRRAREILSIRRRRYQFFGKAMFGEVAWELLLTLYAHDASARQTVSSVTTLVEAPKSTTIRWIEYLEQLGLTQRAAHPTDKRSAFVELTDKGRRSMEAYLSDTLPHHD
jgi:DNA-binding MarR family transcriptional regulator